MPWRPLIRLIFALYCIAACPAFATTYSAIDYPFSWVDPATHTKLGPTLGGLYSTQYKFTAASGCGTTPPNIDDTISDLIPIGFTFTYGGQAFNSVRVMTNGRLQFNNATCGNGSPVTQLPYPNANLNYSMRIYGNDLDPTLKSELSSLNTTCVSRTTCFISYASLGSAPNRTFVVTWNQIPEWAAGSTVTGKYSMQIILKENGEFIYQFKDRTAGTNAATGQIGWQVSTTDYAIAGTGFPATSLAYLFYIPNTGSMAPGAFNAFDTSTWLGSTTGALTTKIAGTAFGFDVIALTSTTPATVQTTFTGAVKVELVNADSSANCSAMTSIQTVTASYTFVSADKGRRTFTGITQANAYSNVKVRLSFPATAPTKFACSTDAFAIRPSYFSFVASDANWTTAGTSRTLNAATAAANPVHKAGHPLTLTITPYNSQGVVTSNYSGSPSLSSVCVLPATGCVSGSFNVGTFSSSGGIATSTTASFNEVGVISVTATDGAFANIDAADGSSVSQRSISSAASNVGRFVPDHFDVALNAPQFSPGCGSFSFIGQPIKYSIRPVATVTAQNLANANTQNYKSELWKINPSHASYGITPSYSEASQSLTIYNAAAASVNDNGDGTGTLSFADTTNNVLSVTRSSPQAAFDAEIALSFNLQDTDAVSVANVNGVAASNPIRFGMASAGNGIAFSGANKSMRWGRLNLQNASGSELKNLSLPLFSEYFDGINFVKNPNDNCSSLSLSSHLKLKNPQTASGAWQPGNTAMTMTPSGTSTASLTNVPLVAGDAGLSFSAPGAGNTGYIDVTGSFSGLPWLLFDWDNNGVHDNDPSAKASFGVYKGNSQQIYWREVY